MSNVISICPACSGPALHFGTLGNNLFFRCRQCGADHHHRVSGNQEHCDCCGELTDSDFLTEVETGDKLCVGCEEDNHYFETAETSL
jgi:hypothetical protein